MRNEEWAKLTRVVHKHQAERFCGGRKSPLHIHCAVIEVCMMNGKMCVRGAGRRGRRPLQVRWQDFSVAESCCYRGLVSFDGRTVFAPTILLPWVLCLTFFIQFSSYVLGVTSVILP